MTDQVIVPAADVEQAIRNLNFFNMEVPQSFHEVTHHMLVKTEQDRTVSGFADRVDMNFGTVLDLLVGGKRARRSSWGPNTFVYMVPGSKFEVNRAPLLGIFEPGHVIDYMPHIDMHQEDGQCSVWQITQEAALASDWQVLEGINPQNVMEQPAA